MKEKEKKKSNLISLSGQNCLEMYIIGGNIQYIYSPSWRDWSHDATINIK